MSSGKDASHALLGSVQPRKNKQVDTWDGKTQYDAIVFEGGGSKGVCYAGALRNLEEAGLLSNIKKFGGTSAGAQTATYLAVGCTPDDLSDINKNTDWSLVFDQNRKCCGEFFNMRRVFKTYACCEGKHLLQIIEDKCEQKTGKKNITFQDLYDKFGVDLHLGCTDLNTNGFVMLSKMTHGDMPISLGAMASSTLPFIYPPVKWKSHSLVDGGLVANLPLKVYEGSRMIAMHLHPDKYDAPPEESPIKNVTGFMGAVMHTMFLAAQAQNGLSADGNTHSHALELHKKKGIDIVNVDCGDCHTVEEHMSEERLKMLEKLGYDSCGDWLKALPPP